MVLTLLFFTSCGTQAVDAVYHRGHVMPRSVHKHVLEFERVCNKKVELPIVFLDKLPFNFIGVCMGFALPGPKMIIIERDWWDKYKNLEIYREELIFHELGHCVLDRWHTEDKIYIDSYGGRPASVMYPKFFGYDGTYEVHRKEYIKELCE